MRRWCVALAALLLGACGSRHAAVSFHDASAARSGPGWIAEAPAPRGFVATSASLPSRNLAFVLGTEACGRSRCPSLLRSGDGGAHWAALAAPRPSRGDGAMASLRFADSLHGLAFGTGLWETDDGARTWRRDSLPPGRLLDLEPVADREWVALLQTGGSISVYRCPVLGGAWARVGRFPVPGSGPVAGSGFVAGSRGARPAALGPLVRRVLLDSSPADGPFGAIVSAPDLQGVTRAIGLVGRTWAIRRAGAGSPMWRTTVRRAGAGACLISSETFGVAGRGAAVEGPAGGHCGGPGGLWLSDDRGVSWRRVSL